MSRKLLIDDIELSDEDEKGPPILFTNQYIRKMLNLVNANEEDIFYDLGSGWGQNLIVARTEFRVKKCVGIEKDKERFAKSIERIKKRRLQKHVKIINTDFNKLISGRLEGANLREATVVFYGLDADKKFLKDITKNLQKGCRFVTYFQTVFPEIMPNSVDYPFYLSVVPFVRPTSQKEWLSTIIQKSKSSLSKNKEPSVSELWEEFSHDYDVNFNREYVDDLKDRLKKVVKR